MKTIVARLPVVLQKELVGTKTKSQAEWYNSGNEKS